MKSKKGYTLIEVVIALGVLLMIASLLPSFLIPIQKQPPLSQLEETSLFFSMLGKEIREGKLLEVNNNILFITDSNGDVKSFSKYHTLIRKQVNGLGHEVWLQNINSIKLEKQSDLLLAIQIIDKDGHEYKRLFRRSRNNE
ncbi:prepilin-type N-terminal cleavage/methylation domain-containing protein [Fictibacillus nanhaiensis]|uniref:competence type IV pilus minor pilin ComGF n=1 Tax=Fictibacillus nanhaiensis TaxID=742169 RepID=UPI001C95B0EC|nr:competence type IV pilus minor pilin ComGF [Fictibacillus nanhaiensis]MBY6035520.1 prepilin-type N-terminal cleavage/methylation domain-containing protein [Fictibacillus nanhaiensis]